MSTFRFEIRGYSPCAYDFYHLGIATGEGDTMHVARDNAWRDFKGSKTFGPEPVSMMLIVDNKTHNWAKGAPKF